MLAFPTSGSPSEDSSISNNQRHSFSDTPFTMRNVFPTVIVLAGIELIFFIAACMVLYFKSCDQNTADNTAMF